MKVSSEFIDEIATRVTRLSKYSDVVDSQMLGRISTSVRLLQEDPPNERSRTDSEATLLKEDLSCQVKSLHATNERLRTGLWGALQELKQSLDLNFVQDEFRQQEFELVQEELEEAKAAQPVPLQAELQSLQQDIRAFKRKFRQSEQFHCEQQLERSEMFERLQRLETALHLFKATQQPDPLCRCFVF